MNKPTLDLKSRLRDDGRWLRTVFAVLGAEVPSNVSQRTLTFAERVAYQRAIEHVYWRHRIWPKDRRSQAFAR